jgi:hypothetical protein
MDARLAENRDLPTLARERVRLGSVPEWVAPCPYDADFKANVRAALTHLLVERQFHAELHQTYVRMALRLETMQSVGEYSQWQLQFEPQTQSITLHSIKTRRGAVETEHASLERLQFLQRESGLEGCAIHGWITLLLLLEDIRPGDVIEFSYTLEDRPRLLPENVSARFLLPAGIEVGKYHFAVRHTEARRVRWKASSPALAPTITAENGDVRYGWMGEKFYSAEPENCTPDWKMDYPWIQISDYPDWQTIARGFLEAWKEEPAGEGLIKLRDEVQSVGPALSSQVNRAIEIVQDRFRYLSVSLELGGQIPAPAETVIRRRYGDCKDTAFLLVRLLRALGVTARPVLVDALAGRGIESFLPSPNIFNHAIVEYELENERRWVDGTMKCQGGGALKRLVGPFGLGLPIDASTAALVPVPKASLLWGSCEVKESFLLDTTGSASYLAVLTVAKGIDAERFRSEFENAGLDVVARNRLQMCADRFSKA